MWLLWRQFSSDSVPSFSTPSQIICQNTKSGLWFPTQFEHESFQAHSSSKCGWTHINTRKYQLQDTTNEWRNQNPRQDVTRWFQPAILSWSHLHWTTVKELHSNSLRSLLRPCLTGHFLSGGAAAQGCSIAAADERTRRERCLGLTNLFKSDEKPGQNSWFESKSSPNSKV